MAYCCMVFFKAGACDLDTAERALRERSYKLSVRRDGERILAGYHNGPEFRIELAADEYVREEAAEIGAGTPHAEPMRECGCRFEIFIEDLDFALDEINTLIEVQATLQEASQGYLFLTWNGTLSPPEHSGG